MAPANFRGLRREIAVALRGKNRRRTLFETSKVLGRRPGDIQRTMRKMHDEGILGSDARESGSGEPGRGTLFWFNEDYADALEQALADDRPTGLLLGEQRMLAVAPKEREGDPYEILGRPDLNGAISWIAEWGGEGELLVAMAQGTPKRSVDQLVRALREAEMRCEQRRVGELMSGEELRRHVAAVDYEHERVGA